MHAYHIDIGLQPPVNTWTRVESDVLQMTIFFHLFPSTHSLHVLHCGYKNVDQSTERKSQNVQIKIRRMNRQTNKTQMKSSIWNTQSRAANNRNFIYHFAYFSLHSIYGYFAFCIFHRWQWNFLREKFNQIFSSIIKWWRKEHIWWSVENMLPKHFWYWDKKYAVQFFLCNFA